MYITTMINSTAFSYGISIKYIFIYSNFYLYWLLTKHRVVSGTSHKVDTDSTTSAPLKINKFYFCIACNYHAVCIVCTYIYIHVHFKLYTHTHTQTHTHTHIYIDKLCNGYTITDKDLMYYLL